MAFLVLLFWCGLGAFFLRVSPKQAFEWSKSQEEIWKLWLKLSELAELLWLQRCQGRQMGFAGVHHISGWSLWLAGLCLRACQHCPVCQGRGWCWRHCPSKGAFNQPCPAAVLNGISKVNNSISSLAGGSSWRTRSTFLLWGFVWKARSSWLMLLCAPLLPPAQVAVRRDLGWKSKLCKGPLLVQVSWGES